MIGLVVSMLASRNGVVAIGSVSLLVTILMWDHGRANRHRAEGAKKAVQASQKKAITNAAKSAKAHAAARKPGAADRLRQQYGR